MKLSTVSVFQYLTNLFITGAGFVATLAFTRLLPQETVGIYFTAVGVIAWLEFVSDAGLRAAVQKRVSERVAPDAALTAGLIVQVGLLGVLLLVLLAGGRYIEQLLEVTTVTLGGVTVPILWLLVAMLAAKAAFTLVDAGIRGRERVGTAAGLAAAERGLRSTLQIGLLLLGFGLAGLLFGYAVTFAVAALLGVLVLVRADYRPVRPTRAQFRDLFDYARFAWLGNLKTQTSAWLDTVVLAVFVSKDLVAVYEVSWNIAMVLALASNSIYRALFPTLSGLSADEDMAAVRDLVERATVFAGFVAIPGLVGVAIVGPDLLHFYGTSYTAGGVIATVLAVTALVSSYEGLYETALNAVDRPDLAFRANVVFIVANVVGNVVLVGIFREPIWAAIATVVSALLSLGVLYLSVSRVVAPRVPYAELGRQSLAALAMGGVVYASQVLLEPYPYYFVVLSVGLGATVYVALAALLSTRVRRTLGRLLGDLLPVAALR